ncbi:TetR family transcriptional regulator [Amycolatopsis balhimycina DSM 5908]|uniref:TetR family transcriptional regulator n=1 Tax=Amycolatopsis balhimycina DSM 5908 TaxID=1081091 RepID=A0A428X607_AMYBA|nr:TetR/AcrR family transcriptional regulator [Amycolatopsis balhimycina]RSM50753.1 TetR family transcriptional regulator [Amycolatopsis balhimycina DSM 5908]
MATTMGRRERRKVQTRQALAAAALRLFLERGYDGVTVAQIAEEADVSLATLFKHVPDGKEAVIFDDGVERREALAATVRDRPAGQSVLAALRGFMLSRGPFATDMSAERREMLDLILRTPALRAYQRKLWTSAEGVLAAAIAAATGRETTDPALHALARFVLEVPGLAGLDPHPRESVHAIFDLLENGWSDQRNGSAEGTAANPLDLLPDEPPA